MKSTTPPIKAAGYAGPWLENNWITASEVKLYGNTSKVYGGVDDGGNGGNGGATTPSVCLRDHFGPFIPILLPWADRLVLSGHRGYPPSSKRDGKGMVATLRAVLRPDVPYITVSITAEGIGEKGRNGQYTFDANQLPNLLVLSAGGYGHVPIPLLKQPEPRNNGKPVSDRRYLVTYVGGLGHTPSNLRLRMKDVVEKAGVTRGTGARTKVYKGTSWRQMMADSRLSLSPRGYGRTSYHLVETLQMGLLPIHVYQVR